ncbi:MAG: pyrroline-5-carboxylate reductase [Pseudomonadota bacterium]
MKKKPIIIIGGGKMGGAIAARWHDAAIAPIHVVEHDKARRAELAAYGIAPHALLADAPRGEVYLLAIKPQQFAAIVPELKTSFAEGSPLLLSIMAGISLEALAQITPRVARIMPNLPALIGEGMSVACAPALDEKTRDRISELFFAVGDCVWVEDEQQMHATTAISGSGPAYLFAVMEALQAAAVTHGLSPHLARELVTQTMVGAALLADHCEDDVTTLRRNVTSPGGTTEAALTILNEDTLRELFNNAITAAVNRSKELG